MLTPPFMTLQVAGVESACGRPQPARARWERLASALARETSPLTLAAADLARRRLGRPLSASQRRRLENGLQTATSTIESAGTSSPGLMTYARGSLLAALGRDGEARQAYRRVFMYPDRGLSHALARSGMRALAGGAVR